MTEKRFIPIFDGIDKRVVGAKDNGEIISFIDMFDLLNEQDAEIERLKEFKNKVFKEINTELSYLTEKAMDNPVNYGRIKALQELTSYLDEIRTERE